MDEDPGGLAQHGNEVKVVEVEGGVKAVVHGLDNGLHFSLVHDGDAEATVGVLVRAIARSYSQFVSHLVSFASSNLLKTLSLPVVLSPADA